MGKHTVQCAYAIGRGRSHPGAKDALCGQLKKLEPASIKTWSWYVKNKKKKERNASRVFLPSEPFATSESQFID